MQKESIIYKDSLPQPWQKYSSLIDFSEVKILWSLLISALKKRGLIIKKDKKTFRGVYHERK
jgi:hypothetical protein